MTTKSASSRRAEELLDQFHQEKLDAGFVDAASLPGICITIPS